MHLFYLLWSLLWFLETLSTSVHLLLLFYHFWEIMTFCWITFLEACSYWLPLLKLLRINKKMRTHIYKKATNQHNPEFYYNSTYRSVGGSVIKVWVVLIRRVFASKNLSWLRDNKGATLRPIAAGPDRFIVYTVASSCSGTAQSG